MTATPRNTTLGVIAAALRRARGYLNTARRDLEDRADRVDALDQIALARRELDAAEKRIRSTMPKMAAAAALLLGFLLLIAAPAPTWAQSSPQLTINNGSSLERYSGTFTILQTAPEGGYIAFHVEQTVQPSAEAEPIFHDDFDQTELAGLPALQQWTVVLDFGSTVYGRHGMSCYGYTHFQPSNGPRAWLVCP